jgi:phenylacetic acid degradation operon negative regulatory protein
VGRSRLYRLSPDLAAAVAAGTEKLFGADEPDWDGEFTLVQYAFDGASRVDRDRFRDLLEVEGFAPLSRGLFVHPRDRSRRVLEAAGRSAARRRVTVFRGRRAGKETDAEFVARLWDLGALARRYREFEATFASADVGGESPARAFGLRLAVAISFLDVAWDDPGLPPSLLPADWPGRTARETARALYETLLPGALAHGDALLARLRSKGGRSTRSHPKSEKKARTR